ncbi:hypothetical protein ACFQT4_08195 [Pseudoduganella danionis]|uniref:hypothetical protein n=1 Tax=Pseudoduganella danionis TaxID=1890295 RepID=UPI003610B799
MTTAITSPSGRTLHLRATRQTTPREDDNAKQIRIKRKKEQRLAENREHLKNANIQAFLKAIADAEGGGYDFKYGAVKGKKKILGVSPTTQHTQVQEEMASPQLLVCTKSTRLLGRTMENVVWV